MLRGTTAMEQRPLRTDRETCPGWAWARVVFLLPALTGLLGACGADGEFIGAPTDTPEVVGLDAQRPETPGPADALPPRDTPVADFVSFSPDTSSDVEREPSPVDAITPDAAGTTPADATGDDMAASPEPWHSALYPPDWTPDHTDAEGRFLHDFSYAGYRNGEKELGVARKGARLVVTDAPFGAVATGEADATAAVQAAVDKAAQEGGGEVFFPEGLYRMDGEVRISVSHVVLRGEGPAASRLWFTASEGRSHRSHVTFAGDLRHDLELPLVEDASARTTEVLVADAADLAVGDDVTLGHVITEAFVEEHGMTGTWRAFNDTWQPFAWRTVVAVCEDTMPHRVTLDVPLRYPLEMRDAASLRRMQGMLAEVGFEGLGVADAVDWEQAWSENQIHAVELNGVRDSWIRDVASFPSPGAPEDGRGSGAHLQSGGIIVRRAKRVTVADTHLADAQNRGGGGNGYLFEVRRSSEILFRDCTARGGRHNFIQNWGFGATGIVWLRIESDDGRVYTSPDSALRKIGYSEFHHSLATANLIDSSWLGDGWSAVNRGDWSTGAGHSATENVLWNIRGPGSVISMQYGWGYVIGTAPETRVFTAILMPNSVGTEPEDWTEGLGQGAALEPLSLYEDQLARRRAREAGP